MGRFDQFEFGNLPVAPAGGLLELHVQTQQGRLTAGLQAAGDGRYAAWRAGTLTPDGGESRETLRGRVSDALAAILADPADLARRDPRRADPDGDRGAARSAPGRLSPVAPASATVIELAGPPRLLAYNLTPPGMRRATYRINHDTGCQSRS